MLAIRRCAVTVAPRGVCEYTDMVNPIAVLGNSSIAKLRDVFRLPSLSNVVQYRNIGAVTNALSRWVPIPSITWTVIGDGGGISNSNVSNTNSHE